MSTPSHFIDLVSDTVTRPTRGMREAIANAEVGDEQRGEDPSTTKLCEMVAALLGKEAAVFLPSGVMCNQISILVHCAAGDEVLLHESAHIVGSEAGGAAALAGATLHPLGGPDGMFSVRQLEEAIRPAKRNAPQARMIAVEQTVNRGGGAIWPLAEIEKVAGFARERGLAMHMDGARLMNAVVASGVAAEDYARSFDSVWLDLSKGLGCPVGSVLAGSSQFIEKAWRWKHRLGGAMRQSGILAAAGIYALENHVDRLKDDHDNARLLAEKLAQLPGISITPDKVQTNLVFFDVRGTGMSAQEIAGKLLQKGVRIGIEGRHRMRAVTHMDVVRTDVAVVIQAFGEVLKEPRGS